MPSASSQPDVTWSLEAGLDRFGLKADPAELEVMRAVEAIYQPHVEALLQADLGRVPAEPDLDLTRAPS